MAKDIKIWRKCLRHLHAMTDIPHYSKTDKKVIAYSIAFEGSISLKKNNNNSIAPVIELVVSEKDLLESFYSIAVLGYVKSYKQKDYNYDMHYWACYKTLEVYYILANIIDYIPSKRKKEIAKKVMNYIENRIKKGTLKHRIPIKDDDIKFYEEVRQLNKSKEKRDEKID